MSRKSDAETSSKALKDVPAGGGKPQPMDRNRRIENEVEETLGGFARDISPAPGSDFYARVLARVRSGDEAARGARAPFFRRWVLLPAALGIMITLNVITAVTLARKPASVTPGRQQAMLALAEEYDLKTGTESGYWK